MQRAALRAWRIHTRSVALTTTAVLHAAATRNLATTCAAFALWRGNVSRGVQQRALDHVASLTADMENARERAGAAEKERGGMQSQLDALAGTCH